MIQRANRRIPFVLALAVILASGSIARSAPAVQPLAALSIEQPAYSSLRGADARRQLASLKGGASATPRG